MGGCVLYVFTEVLQYTAQNLNLNEPLPKLSNTLRVSRLELQIYFSGGHFEFVKKAAYSTSVSALVIFT